jgi:uncharacterized Zn ribbon protein
MLDSHIHPIDDDELTHECPECGALAPWEYHDEYCFECFECRHKWSWPEAAETWEDYIEAKEACYG